MGEGVRTLSKDTTQALTAALYQEERVIGKRDKNNCRIEQILDASNMSLPFQGFPSCGVKSLPRNFSPV
jgi:hypothetical protein